MWENRSKFSKTDLEFEELGYTFGQLLIHFENCLHQGCHICQEPINHEDEIWHISHIFPVSESKGWKEVKKYYCLCNLHVAHDSCNSASHNEIHPFSVSDFNYSVPCQHSYKGLTKNGT
jgi:hypothetical protein